MTKGKSKGSTAVDRAAEAVGHALGTCRGHDRFFTGAASASG